MKQLKSTATELRELFDLHITVRHIAEFDLHSAGVYENGAEVRRRMKELDFDVAPVVKKERVVGYVVRNKLVDGPCGDQAHAITTEILVAESTPILYLFELLSVSSWRFVLVKGDVEGIVTRGDLRKAPVRMFLFSLINLLEMQLGRLISLYRPSNAWKSDLSETRIKKAECLLEERMKRNEAVDLLDCLYFYDKATVATKTTQIMEVLPFESKSEAKSFFSKVLEMRDRIAHAHDLIGNGAWEDVFELSFKLEQVVLRFEEVKRSE